MSCKQAKLFTSQSDKGYVFAKLHNVPQIETEILATEA